MYCQYYQAKVNEKDCWFFVAILKSFEHMAFDRTYDKTNSIFEFLVPEGNEQIFLNFMSYFIENNIISDLKKLDNRLKDPTAIV